VRVLSFSQSLSAKWFALIGSPTDDTVNKAALRATLVRFTQCPFAWLHGSCDSYSACAFYIKCVIYADVSSQLDKAAAPVEVYRPSGLDPTVAGTVHFQR
jgi:hypothetical protein